MYRIGVVALFPELVVPVTSVGVVGRARERGLIALEHVSPRDFTTDRHRTVDDRPYGGGPGMVLKYEPLRDAVRALRARLPAGTREIVLTAQGRPFDQKLAESLAKHPRLLLIAGHYEGFDERIIEGLRPLEVSIGDYVLSGGELAAMVVVDAVVRLLPGALGAEDGAADETFAGGLLEHPQYTKPPVWEGRAIPPVLLSGDHGKIAAWRRREALRLTAERRPDLLSTTNRD